MDELDQARVLSDLFLKDAITRARGPVSTGESRLECLECGEPIPEARRQAVPGCTLCIECQEEREDERA